MTCPFVHWVSLFICLCINYNSMPIDKCGEAIALSIGGLIVVYRIIEFNRKRAVISNIVEDLNLIKKIVTQERKEFCELSQRIHFWQYRIGTTMTIIGGGIAIPQALFALHFQDLYYDHLFPVDTSEMSLEFLVVWVFQSFTVFTCTICSCLQECILTDCFIQLIFNYYALNVRAEELRWSNGGKVDEEREYEKLIQIIKDYQKLELITNALNGLTNVYLTMIMSVFYVVVSISVYVLISVADQGFLFIVKNLMYPLFTSAVMILWCFLGQKLVDQVSYQMCVLQSESSIGCESLLHVDQQIIGFPVQLQLDQRLEAIQEDSVHVYGAQWSSL